MKKKTNLFARAAMMLLLAVLSSIGVRAQEAKIIVWLADGNKSEVLFADMPELTYADGNVNIQSNSPSTTFSWPIENVQKLTFENIGELATQAAYFTNVQDISKTRTVLGLNVPFTTSKYIFSYDGVIKAGMNFADIDVHEDPLSRTVKITLPEIRVLSIDIDTDSLKIYDERRNIYSPLNLENVNDSLAEMKREAEQNAIANGLFDGARTNAEVLLRGFLAGTYDPEQWRIEFIEPASTKDKESRDDT